MSIVTIFYPIQIDYGISAFRIEDHIGSNRDMLDSLASVAEREDAILAAIREYTDARRSKEEEKIARPFTWDELTKSSCTVVFE